MHRMQILIMFELKKILNRKKALMFLLALNVVPLVASSALQLLAMTFFGNLMLIGFFIVFSLFFESAILMSFTSLSAVMAVHTFYLVATGLLSKIDIWYEKAAKWCFTRHLDDLFAVKSIEKILEGKETLFSDATFSTLTAIAGWSALFFILAGVIFSRRQILH